jgi:hypothetical protein
VPQAWLPVLGSLRIALVAAAVAIVAELLDRSMRHRRSSAPNGIRDHARRELGQLTIPMSLAG